MRASYQLHPFSARDILATPIPRTINVISVLQDLIVENAQRRGKEKRKIENKVSKSFKEPKSEKKRQGQGQREKTTVFLINAHHILGLDCETGLLEHFVDTHNPLHAHLPCIDL